ARTVLMPLLDVLQSVPILSFLPVVLLSLSAILPQAFAVELAAIVLIFTSQAWNMTFSFYQSMTTIPTELREAAAVFRFDPWLRFKAVELPFAAIGLLWNSIMSWSGGWFFLMAAEIFHVGARDFRLHGLGAYLVTSANEGNSTAVHSGVITMVGVIVSLGDGNPNGFLACGFIRELSGGKPDGYPSGFGMGRIGKGDCRHFPPGERCTGDYVDLDHSCRGVYWNEPPPLDLSPTDRASRC